MCICLHDKFSGIVMEERLFSTWPKYVNSECIYQIDTMGDGLNCDFCTCKFVVKIYSQFQNYLREQPDNIKSVNLVAETTRFVNILYSNITNLTIELLVQLFDTLVEYTSVSIITRLLAF